MSKEDAGIFLIAFVIVMIAKICDCICKKSKPSEESVYSSGGFMTSRALQPRNSLTSDSVITSRPTLNNTQMTMPMPHSTGSGVQQTMPLPYVSPNSHCPYPLNSQFPYPTKVSPYSPIPQVPYPSQCPYPPQSSNSAQPPYPVSTPQEVKTNAPHIVINLPDQSDAPPPNFEEAMKMIQNQDKK